MTIIAILGCAQGLLLVIFLASRKNNRLANRCAALSIFFSIIQSGILIIMYNSPENVTLLKLRWFTAFLAFPIPLCLYFYVVFTISGDSKLRVENWPLHLLPILISFIYTYRLLAPSSVHKVDLLSAQNTTFLVQFGVLEWIRAFLIIVYAAHGIALVQKCEKTQPDRIAGPDGSNQLNWLRLIVVCSLIIGSVELFGSSLDLWSIVRNKITTPLHHSFTLIVLSFVTLAFYFASYKAISTPNLFEYEYWKAKQKDLKDAHKYRHSILNKKDLEQMAERLLDLMEEEKPFLKTNLSVSELAKQLNVSKNDLSQLLNEFFEKNFYDFINDYRTQEAKRRLLDPANHHLTIVGIAMESGFRSKSTFYTHFKSATGLTPVQFQRQLEEGSLCNGLGVDAKFEFQ